MAQASQSVAQGRGGDFREPSATSGCEGGSGGGNRDAYPYSGRVTRTRTGVEGLENARASGVWCQWRGSVRCNTTFACARVLAHRNVIRASNCV